MTDQYIIVGWMKVEDARPGACGRELLRRLLLDEYSIDLSGEREPIARQEGGKPFLAAHCGIYFNISHSGDYVVCAVGEVPLGIDIQYQKKGDHRKLGKRIMTPKEWERYEGQGLEEEFLFRCWTKKESYLKYTGEGIRRDLRTLAYEKCRFLECSPWPEYSGMLCVPEDWSGTLIIREMKK